MRREQNQIDGQITFPMCLNAGHYVVQANDLIDGKQALSLNAAKLLRISIMQIMKEDTELRPYSIQTKELAKILEIDSSNLYRTIDSVTEELMKKLIVIRSGRSFVKLHWVDACCYDDRMRVVTIQLSNQLKPYLINLREYYTQYSLDNILTMKSVYAIRIFELIQKECRLKLIPAEGTSVELSVEKIRESCDLYNYDGDNIVDEKYSQFGAFKNKVIDIAVKEIERTTLYSLTYDYIKVSRTITGFNFHLNMKYH